MDRNSNEVLRDIPFHLLEEITDGFSNERKLGSGAFGKVYMGVHENGEKIAVKMLYDVPGLEEEHFLNEFYNLANLQHTNIVRLVGYCHEIQKKYVEYNGRMIFAERICRALCLEYMHNGSIDKFLSEEHHGLDWNTRYAMIKGICKGLEYLHEKLKHPIYHLDLKPANILLGENMVPKIADFGLSRLFGEEKTQITKSPIGTLGYLPPEYLERNIISNKFDIFSLGVVIIKIMSGPTGYSKSAELSPQQFTELVHENWRSRLKAMGVEFLESYSAQVKICIEIALRCVDTDRHKRPRIGDIVQKLDETETLMQNSAAQLPHMGKNDLGPTAYMQVSTGSAEELRSTSLDAAQYLLREPSMHPIQVPGACVHLEVLALAIVLTAWLHCIRDWKKPLSNVLVVILFLLLTWYPYLILPTMYLCLFLIRVFNFWRQQTQMADSIHPSKLAEELNAGPPPGIVDWQYSLFLKTRTSVQELFYEVAERGYGLLMWRDGRASVMALGAAVVLTMLLCAVPRAVVFVTWVMLFVLRVRG